MTEEGLRMTMERVAHALGALALAMANELKVPPPTTGLTEAEWAYVRGIGSAAVLQLRERLVASLDRRP